MKLSAFKGLAHDLANHIHYDLMYAPGLKEIKPPFSRNVIKSDNRFDQECEMFFKTRLPKSFDFSRIDAIIVSVKRVKKEIALALTIHVEVRIEGKSFSSKLLSTHVV